MSKKLNVPPTAAELRRRAEERLREQRPATSRAPSDADTQRLVHELQVHQIELEMQNEELQQARDEMEAGLEKYCDLYDFAPVGYLTLDREGTIREANLRIASLLGIERSRLVNRRFRLCVSASDRPAFNLFLTQLFESKAKGGCEITLLKEGEPPIAVRFQAAVAASGQECRAVVEDITEQKRAEEDRLVLNNLESTGILAAGIAHDYNNLLMVILLNLELAQALTPLGKEMAALLKAAKEAAMTSGGLTQQLLAFAKGGLLVRKPTQLSAVIQESVRLAVSGSPIRCDFALPEDLWLAEVDAGQIGQVIRNLVLNAREAMPKGGVVSVRAENVVLGPREHHSLAPGDYVRVSITDWGGGIPKELLPKIFDPYFSTKEMGLQKGMGLGLTICHTVMQKHGGAIAVESQAGMGTTFRLHLPASRRLVRKEDPAPLISQPRGARILVMHDEEVVRKLVKRLLEQMGHEVGLEENGQGAIAAYETAKDRGRPFEAVILDLTVRDGVGGKETIRELLKLDPAVEAIVMSGYADDPVVLEPERYGFKGVLAKPFDRYSLQRVLARVLTGGR
jgi:PAS domain S-box-containing protein